MKGDGGITREANSALAAPLEIQTKVSPNTMGAAKEIMDSKTAVYSFGASVFHEDVTATQAARMLHQVAVLNPSFSMYVVALETKILQTVFVRFMQNIQEENSKELLRVVLGVSI